jgi:hypothetical protein
MGVRRVFKGKKMPGRMGGERVTAQRLQVFKIDVQRNVLFIKGSVPGPDGKRRRRHYRCRWLWREASRGLTRDAMQRAGWR